MASFSVSSGEGETIHFERVGGNKKRKRQDKVLEKIGNLVTSENENSKSQNCEDFVRFMSDISDDCRLAAVFGWQLVQEKETRKACLSLECSFCGVSMKLTQKMKRKKQKENEMKLKLLQKGQLFSIGEIPKKPFPIFEKGQLLVDICNVSGNNGKGVGVDLEMGHMEYCVWREEDSLDKSIQALEELVYSSKEDRDSTTSSTSKSKSEAKNLLLQVLGFKV